MKKNKIKVTSGIGQYHTNEPDQLKPEKKLTPYLAIDWLEIQDRVDHPESVEKTQGQWLISSTLPRRNAKAQEADGLFHLLWADLDKAPPSIPELAVILEGFIGEADYEIYNTRSATEANQKARILIPVTDPLSSYEFKLLQQVLNDKFSAVGIEPDPANLGCSQVCYLPNAGAIYSSASRRDGKQLDPVIKWAKELCYLCDKQDEQQAVLLEATQRAVERRSALTLSNTVDPVKRLIGTFDQGYTPHEFMLNCSYDQDGDSFRHPNSESGNYSATVRRDDQGVWRVNALSTSDPLYTAGAGAHDAFSVFTVLHHNGDIKAAMIDAGDNWLSINGESYNKVVRREHQQKKDASVPKIDVTELLNPKVTSTVSAITDQATPTDQTALTAQAPLAFKLVSAGEVMTREINFDWQIKGLFECRTYGQIFGPTGSGKSFVVLDMAYCIAAGIDYHGHETKQGNVVYICGEGFSGLNRRLKALQGKYNQDIGNNFFISEQPGAFTDAIVTSNVCEAIKAVGGVSLVIIDTLHRNMGDGDESSSSDFGKFLRNIDNFLKPLGVTVLIIHHSGHESTGRSRGTSAIRGSWDFEYQTTLKNDCLTLKNTKMKDAPQPPPLSFEFAPVTLGEDDDGYPITSAVLNFIEASNVIPAVKSRAKLSAHDDAVLQTLNDAITQCGVEPSAEIKAKFGGFDSVIGKLQKVVHIDHWRELAYKSISADGDTPEKKADSRKKAFTRCRKKLFNDNYTVEHGDYAWRIFESNQPILLD